MSPPPHHSLRTYSFKLQLSFSPFSFFFFFCPILLHVTLFNHFSSLPFYFPTLLFLSIPRLFGTLYSLFLSLLCQFVSHLSTNLSLSLFLTMADMLQINIYTEYNTYRVFHFLHLYTLY